MWMIACGSVQPTPRLYCVLLSCLFEVVGWDQDQEEEEVDTSYSSNVHTVTQKIYTLQQHQQADCTLMHINGICDYRKEHLDSLKYIGEHSHAPIQIHRQILLGSKYSLFIQVLYICTSRFTDSTSK